MEAKVKPGDHIILSNCYETGGNKKDRNMMVLMSDDQEIKGEHVEDKSQKRVINNNCLHVVYNQ